MATYELQRHDGTWGGWRAVPGPDDEPKRFTSLGAATDALRELQSFTRTTRYRIYDRDAGRAVATLLRRN